MSKGAEAPGRWKRRTLHSSTNSSEPICSLEKSARISLFPDSASADSHTLETDRCPLPQADQLGLVLSKEPRDVREGLARIQPMLEREARR